MRKAPLRIASLVRLGYFAERPLRCGSLLRAQTVLADEGLASSKVRGGCGTARGGDSRSAATGGDLRK